MCTWNGAPYLPAQLGSIIKQKRKPDELVVCDDVSSDTTRKILDSFAADSNFPVRIIENAARLGSTENFAQAISNCNGDVIVLADQDDVWDSTKLSVTEEHFQKRSDLGGIFTNAELIDQHGNKLNEFLWNAVGFNYRKKSALQGGRGLESLIQGNYVTGATLAFRSCWRNLLLPIPSGWVHDHWIATLLSVATQLDFDQATLIQYRIHPLQQLGVRNRRRIDSAIYLRAAQRSDEVASRFKQFDALDPNEVLERCFKISRHFRFRGTLPKERSKRIGAIVHETLNGNYFRYSMGMKSILRDLIWDFGHGATNSEAP